MLTRSKSRFRISIALAAILAGLITTPSAQAVSVMREIPSTVWGHTYAGRTSTSVATASPEGKRLEKKSNFVVTYTNFPLWAKTEVQAAIDVWSANFASTVPITVEATWGRSASATVLGSARPGNYFSDFVGTPDPTLWYPSALANAIAKVDLDTSSPEIVIRANSDAPWNERNDGTPTLDEYDLESVFIHELGHGLGFLSTDAFDTYFKFGIIDQPTAFDAYAQTPDGQRLSDIASPSYELGLALTNTLVWSGPLGIAANNGVKPRLYAPTRYEVGSSVSHLDEATFSSSGLNAVMTPNLNAGEVFHEPGPLLVAMLEDMRTKPPAGNTNLPPLSPQSPAALVGDRSAVITFGLPANARSAQISNYVIKNEKTGVEISATSSPVAITGLKNGTSYTFSIYAKNVIGQSPTVLTNPVIPQPAWRSTVLDALADGKHVATTTFQDQPAILYTVGSTRSLKLARWTGKSWKKVTIDGRGGSSGRTSHDVSGPISLCVSGNSSHQVLHFFYADMVDKDLRHATYDGTTFKYEIVDGNGPIVQPYGQPNRVRTASDVSVTNACASTAAGIQVFYRDETQGILLGAVKDVSGKWRYELIDGDSKNEGRTTGDVAMHLRAVAVGSKVFVLYDSILVVNQQKQAISGEVRLATRIGITPVWSYRTLDTSKTDVAVAGYDLSLNKTMSGVIAGWFTASRISIPRPTQIRWQNVTLMNPLITLTSAAYGSPDSPLSVDNRTMVFGCQGRICALDLSSQSSKPSIKLISNARRIDRIESSWVSVNKIRYAVASVAGKITLLRP